MKYTFTMILLAFVVSFSCAQQAPVLVPATVIAVHDGDGAKVRFDDGRIVPIRFTGIDAPEIRSNVIMKSQPYGREAGDSLRLAIKGRVVLLDTLTIKGPNQRDKFGRLMADAYMSDTTSISLWLIERGHAWAITEKNRRLPKINSIFKSAAAEAKGGNRGLWRSYLNSSGKKARVYTPETWRKKYYYGQG